MEFESKEALELKLIKRHSKIDYCGKIIFYLDNKEVGRTDLINHSSMEDRHILAEIAKVEKYNDFVFLNPNGTPRVKASTQLRADILLGDKDIYPNFGIYEGKMYENYKHKQTCPSCGSITYRLPIEAKLPV